MSQIIIDPNVQTGFLLILFSLIGALAGMVYNTMSKRIEKCESSNDVLIKIATDVEHIKRNCVKC